MIFFFFYYSKKRQRTTAMNSLVHYICIRIRYCLERDVFAPKRTLWEKKCTGTYPPKNCIMRCPLAFSYGFVTLRLTVTAKKIDCADFFFALTFSVRFCFPVRPNWFKNTKRWRKHCLTLCTLLLYHAESLTCIFYVRIFHCRYFFWDAQS